MRRRTLLAVLMMAKSRGTAFARRHPRFEPTDLEIEEPGVAELDVQIGFVRGTDAWRLVVPDFELDLGILDNLEIDLDGAYAVEGVDVGKEGPVLFDHQAPDNLWPSVRLAIGDWHNRTTDRAWALGLQAGPKLPIAPNASGIGFEGLVLVGTKLGPVHAILNAGVIADPRISGAARPTGIEGGIDLTFDIVPRRWAFIGELGGIHFISDDDEQLVASAGAQWSYSKQLDLSLAAFAGFANGSDPFGILLGASPKVAVW